MRRKCKGKGQIDEQRVSERVWLCIQASLNTSRGCKGVTCFNKMIFFRYTDPRTYQPHMHLGVHQCWLVIDKLIYIYLQALGVQYQVIIRKILRWSDRVCVCVYVSLCEFLEFISSRTNLFHVTSFECDDIQIKYYLSSVLSRASRHYLPRF